MQWSVHQADGDCQLVGPRRVYRGQATGWVDSQCGMQGVERRWARKRWQPYLACTWPVAGQSLHDHIEHPQFLFGAVYAGVRFGRNDVGRGFWLWHWRRLCHWDWDWDWRQGVVDGMD